MPHHFIIVLVVNYEDGSMAGATNEIATNAFQLIRIREIVSITTLSRSTIYRLVQNQQFPAPIKLTPYTSAWRQQDIELWIERRAA